MRNRQLGVLAAVVLSAGSWAGAAAGPVLREIPDTACAFVVAHDLAGACGKVDAFLKAIGLEKDDRPESVLAEAMKGLKLPAPAAGEGVALVVMDFQGLGVDGVKAAMDLVAQEGGWPKLASVPVVAYVPGGDVGAVLAAYKPEKAGERWTFQTAAGLLHAAGRNGYTLVSPMPKALEAALAARKPVTGRLAKADLELIGRNDVSGWVDMRVVGPLYVAFMQKTYAKMMQEDEPATRPADSQPGETAVARQVAGLVDTLMEEVTDTVSYSAGIRLEKTGIVGEYLTTSRPESPTGRLCLGLRPGRRELLNRLPTMPYWGAWSADWSGTGAAAQAVVDQQGRKLSAQWRLLTVVMQAGGMAPAAGGGDLGKEVESLVSGAGKQLAGVQVAVGSGGPGGGLAGACVVKCADAQEVRTLLARGTDLVNAFIRLAVPTEKETGLAYARQADSLDGVPVDRLGIQGAAAIQAVLGRVTGQTPPGLLVTAADKGQVVMTVGGPEGFLREAVAATRAAQDKFLDPREIADAVPYLPENMISLGLLKVGAMLESIKTLGGLAREPGDADDEDDEGARKPASRPAPAAPEPPVVMAQGPAGGGMRTVFYVPTKAVAGSVEWVRSLLPKPRFPGAQKATTQEAADENEENAAVMR